MDTNPDRPDDLSALAARLSAWEPACAGLNADAMLFAAGGAAARPGVARLVWPLVACAMAVVAATLGVWLGAERAERQALAQQLRRSLPAPSPDLPQAPAIVSVPTEPRAVEETAPSSLLAAHRALEHGLDAWPARRTDAVGETPAPSSPVFRVGQYDALLDP